LTATKPLCSLSLDLDNQWSYIKTHGDEGWEHFPSYLDVVVPRFLEVLQEFGWTITVFIVGQDAALDVNRGAIEMIAGSGHEIGNHSFHHEPWLHLYSEDQISEEIRRAEEAIRGVTGATPRGFRGPGYSLSKVVLEVLADRRYHYDASTFPTYLGPLARAYYFMTSSFSAEERNQRKALFGSIRDGLRPLKPYAWDIGQREIIEIPVTTIPVVKIPFHFSYLLYMGTYSAALASAYFKTALRLCRMTGTEPSLLLHPLDFLGGDDVPELGFFPAMRLDGGRKLELLRGHFHILRKRFDVVPMADHARHIQSKTTIGSRVPDFPLAPRADTD
jgi:hypothetical protein